MVYVRTDARTGKAKRIRNNPAVRIAPSTRGGKVTGDWVKGDAHFVDGEQASRILELFKRKYGILGKMLVSLGRLRGKDESTVIAIKV
jgi:PPOX class probable F420-dependent enzyme